MLTLKTNPFANPYRADGEPDRHALWEMLVARDSQAFAAADWSLCAHDFEADCFEGISAHGALDPMRWSLRYPTIESYRDDWLAMADVFSQLPLARVTHLELLHKMQRFANVQIEGDRALVWKRFTADEPLIDGGRYQIAAQSVYRLRRIGHKWLIVGFVGYLPLEAAT